MLLLEVEFLVCLMLTSDFDDPIADWESTYGNGLLKKLKASIVQFFLPMLVTNARCWWKFQ